MILPFWVLMAGSLTLTSLQVEAQGEADTARQIIHILDADTVRVQQGPRGDRTTMIGQVKLFRPDSLYMYCDSATLRDNRILRAFGRVVILQGDSTSAFCDSLFYNANTDLARLAGNVVLIQGQRKLFTSQLNYDVDRRLAFFNEKSYLTDREMQMSSLKGRYNLRDEVVHFRDSVVILHPDFELKTDSLDFRTELDEAVFLGPTLIVQDDRRIYCEAGLFNVETQNGRFEKHAQYSSSDGEVASADRIDYDSEREYIRLVGEARYGKGDQRAAADTIEYFDLDQLVHIRGNGVFRDSSSVVVGDDFEYNLSTKSFRSHARAAIADSSNYIEADLLNYNDSTGLGEALGNVIWMDTSEDVTIFCDTLFYNEKEGDIRAFGWERPLLIKDVDGDTLWLSAELLEGKTGTDDTNMFKAYRDVRIFKSDFQGVSDSLVYRESTSSFHLFLNPLLWTDSTQFSGDTIDIFLVDNDIDRMLIYDRSFIVNMPYDGIFNQIKGRRTTARFSEGRVDHMFVEGNAESIYFLQDDEKAFVGINQAACSEIRVNFLDNDVREIIFLNKPSAVVIPIQRADIGSLKLDGFRWIEKGRPTSSKEFRRDSTKTRPLINFVSK